MSEINLTSENFNDEVLNSDKTVLVDFWASWCGPCQMMGPVVAQIAEEHPEYKVCKVNVDEQQELAMKYNIMSIPYFAVFKKGQLVESTLGAQPKDNLLELLK